MNNTNSLMTIFSSPFTIVLIAVFIFLVIGFFVLVAVIIRMSAQLRYITYPVYDQIVKEAQGKASKIIDDAQIQSRSLISTARESAEKILHDRKEENEKFREEYTKSFEEIVSNGKETLSNQSVEEIKLSQNILDEFKKHALASEVLMQKGSGLISETLSEESDQLKRTFAEMSEKAKKEQNILIEETKKHVSEEIAKEISTAHDAIIAYKKERFVLLDHEIVGLVEETARIALNKTLSLRDHRDQVIVALEEAKKDGIFDK